MEATSATVNTKTVGKRSRTGCYTCRIRKVKCKNGHERHEANHEDDQTSGCENCKSLDLDCRWSAPKPGEEYAPPPKKRRLLGQRPRRTTAKSLVNVGLDSHGWPESQCGPSSTHVQNAQSQASPPRTTDNSNDLPFNFDAHTDFEFMNLDLTGEGFDLFPLPSIDLACFQSDEFIDIEGRWSTTADLPVPVTSTSEPATQRSNSDVNQAEDLSVNETNRRLIQHYLEVMKGYAKVNDRSKDTDNVFISTFSMALSFSPLFYAILAFSAAHLALDDSDSSSSATKYAQLAQTSFNTHRQHHPLLIEGLLSALFIRIKTLHVTAGNMNLILDLVSETVSLISTSEGEAALRDENGLTKRIVTRIALLDSRASYYRLGGGKLISYIETLPSFAPVFEMHPSLAETPASAVDVTSLLRANILRMRVAKIEADLHTQRNAEIAISYPVRVQEIMALYDQIQHQIDAWDRRLSNDNKTVNGSRSEVQHPRHPTRSPITSPETSQPLTPSHYAQITVSCALHAAFLYLHWVYPLPSHPPTRSTTTNHHHSLLIQSEKKPSAKPSAILPSAFFLAGLCSTDIIHRDWILGRLRQSGKGGYVEKVGVLLVNIWQMMDDRSNREQVHNEVRGRLDQRDGSASGGVGCSIRDVMDSRCGGRFLI